MTRELRVKSAVCTIPQAGMQNVAICRNTQQKERPWCGCFLPTGDQPDTLRCCEAYNRASISSSVRLAPRTQRTATSWLLFVQCTMPDSNEGVIRDVFHAGLRWDVRRFFRLRYTGQPIWLHAHIAVWRRNRGL